MRTAEIKRSTAETDISLRLNLDGTGAGKIATGVGFLDHMLTLFAKHGRFDLDVTCTGDTVVDDHHSVEDIGIVLGAVLWVLTNVVKKTKGWHPIVFIGISTVVGMLLGM